jgi:hypothetical protein
VTDTVGEPRFNGREFDLPARGLVATLLEQAIAALRVNGLPCLPVKTKLDRVKRSQMEFNPCTRHWIGCGCRECAEDFFLGHLRESAEPCNFLFCCDALDLKPRAVLDGLTRRGLLEAR